MSMPNVLNRHTATAEKKSNAIYIGRGTKWGNPYIIGVDGDRREVVEKYRRYLLDIKPELIVAAKKELRGKDLLCSCSPLACHGDILLKVANE